MREFNELLGDCVAVVDESVGWGTGELGGSGVGGGVEGEEETGGKGEVGLLGRPEWRWQILGFPGLDCETITNSVTVFNARDCQHTVYPRSEVFSRSFPLQRGPA